jgi:predicted Zn-dependent protease
MSNLPGLAAAAGLIALGALGCLLEDGPGYDPIDVIVPSFTEDEEREIGMKFDRALQEQVRIIQDPVVASFLNDLGQRIVREIEPQPFIYRFRVIENPSLNAFAVFGGYVYFHSGTLLAASSVDELAGVMGHEIAHVRMRHHARMEQKTKIPSLIAGLGGIAAASATGEPAILLGAQSANVVLKLHFSRAFEAEADHHGAQYMARAGYDPAGIERFFQRILDEERQIPDAIPPYLYSHPDVKTRIAAVEVRAAGLEPGPRPADDLDDAMREAQARLAALLARGRTNWIEPTPAFDLEQSGLLIRDAERAEQTGDDAQALELLARAAAAQPNDPRVHFRRGEILQSTGRHAEAAQSYRQTIRLDPTPALVFFRLGETHKALADRHRAVSAFEQAAMRAGPKSSLQRRAEWEVAKLTFTIVEEDGVAEADGLDDAPPPLERAVAPLPIGARRIAWWARLGARFAPHAERMRVRWIDPSGATVDEVPVQKLRRSYVWAALELERPGAAAGRWQVALLLDGDVVQQRALDVGGAQ